MYLDSTRFIPITFIDNFDLVEKIYLPWTGFRNTISLEDTLGKHPKLVTCSIVQCESSMILNRNVTIHRSSNKNGAFFVRCPSCPHGIYGWVKCTLNKEQNDYDCILQQKEKIQQCGYQRTTLELEIIDICCGYRTQAKSPCMIDNYSFQHATCQLCTWFSLHQCVHLHTTETMQSITKIMPKTDGTYTYSLRAQI